jgi:DNA-binding beta-propeller fold protein YncE
MKSYAFKWSPQTNNMTIVTGDKSRPGSTDELLNHLTAIHIDRNTGALYVTDQFNHRIQLWFKGAKKGITVAGSSSDIKGDDNTSLNSPSGMLVDGETGTVYMADTENDRN